MADVLVCTTGEDLDVSSGLARLFLLNGGNSIETQAYSWYTTFGKLPFGGCAIITPGALQNTKHLMFTNGPNWNDPDLPDSNPDKVHIMSTVLRQSVYNALDTAQFLDASSVTLPPISTGYNSFPVELCADVMLSSMMEWASVCTTNKIT